MCYYHFVIARSCHLTCHQILNVIKFKYSVSWKYGKENNKLPCLKYLQSLCIYQYFLNGHDRVCINQYIYVVSVLNARSLNNVISRHCTAPRLMLFCNSDYSHKNLFLLSFIYCSAIVFIIKNSCFYPFFTTDEKLMQNWVLRKFLNLKEVKYSKLSLTITIPEKCIYFKYTIEIVHAYDEEILI